MALGSGISAATICAIQRSNCTIGSSANCSRRNPSRRYSRRRFSRFRFIGYSGTQEDKLVIVKGYISKANLSRRTTAQNPAQKKSHPKVAKTDVSQEIH